MLRTHGNLIPFPDPAKAKSWLKSEEGHRALWRICQVVIKDRSHLLEADDARMIINIAHSPLEELNMIAPEILLEMMWKCLEVLGAPDV